VRPSAFTADGLAWRQAGKQIMVFNRSSGAWSQPILDIQEGLLIGAEGNYLVFLLMNKATLRRVPEPPVALVMATAK
jgi:lipid-binding SYLF domain-containing protein